MFDQFTTLRDVQAVHPFPWMPMLLPKGNVKVFDAAGIEVSIAALVMFGVIGSTALIQAQQRAAATAGAPS